MIEEMEIGILLSIEGDALGKLGVIRQRMLKADAVAKQLTGTFDVMGKTIASLAAPTIDLGAAFADATANMRAMTRAATGLGVSSKRTAAFMEAVGASTRSAGDSMESSTANVSAMAGQMDMLAASAASVKAAMGEAAVGSRMMGRVNSGVTRRADVTEGAALEGAPAWHKGVYEHANKLWELAMPAIGLDMAGHGFADMMRPAFEYDTIKEQMRVQDGSAYAQKAAQIVGGLSKSVPTLSPNAGMEAYKELYLAFPKQHEVGEFLPGLARADFVLRNMVPGGENLPAGQQMFSMAKTLELRGATVNLAQFHKQETDMMRGVEAGAGVLTPAMFMAMAKYTRFGLPTLSDKFFYGRMSAFLQDLVSTHGGGASSAGAALTSFMREVVAGKVNKGVDVMATQIGLIKKGSVLEMSGGNDIFTKGGFKGRALAQTDPYAWVQKYFLPDVEKKYGGHASVKEIALESTRIFGSNQIAAQLVDYFSTQQKRYDADLAKWERAQPFGSAYKSLLKQSPAAIHMEVDAQLDRLLTQMNRNVIPELVSAGKMLAAGMGDAAAFFKAHPDVGSVIDNGILLTMGAVGLRLVYELGAWFIKPLMRFGPKIAVAGEDAAKGLLAVETSSALLSPKLMGFMKGLDFATTALMGIEALKYVTNLDPQAKIPGQELHYKNTALDSSAANIAHQVWDRTHPGHPWIPPAGHSAPVIHNHFYVDGDELAVRMENRMMNTVGAPSGVSQFSTSSRMLHPSNPPPTGG
jgi:hypothetical protein